MPNKIMLYGSFTEALKIAKSHDLKWYKTKIVRMGGVWAIKCNAYMYLRVDGLVN